MCWWIDETPPPPGDQEIPKCVRITVAEKGKTARQVAMKYNIGQIFDLDNYAIRKDVSGLNHEHFGIIAEIGVEREFLSAVEEAYLIVEYL